MALYRNGANAYGVPIIRNAGSLAKAHACCCLVSCADLNSIPSVELSATSSNTGGGPAPAGCCANFGGTLSLSGNGSGIWSYIGGPGSSCCGSQACSNGPDAAKCRCMWQVFKCNEACGDSCTWPKVRWTASFSCSFWNSFYGFYCTCTVVTFQSICLDPAVDLLYGTFSLSEGAKFFAGNCTPGCRFNPSGMCTISGVTITVPAP
jgi:hypothetical protein